MSAATALHSALAGRIRGSVVVPGDVGYETDRQVWNARFDRRPTAIVFVAGPDDVAATLDYAASRSLPITVRAGGHSPAGWSSIDDGIVIDLRRLNEILVAKDGRVTVGGGTIVADLVRRLDNSGLVLPVGTCAGVGIGGLTLSGGLGHLNGCLGLTCDALRWAEIVLADGGQRIASVDEEPELFWALRGAGANFGVVTRLGFQATRLAQGFGGVTAFRGRPVPDVVRTFRDLCLAAGDDLGLELRLLGTGAGTTAILSAFWAGDPRDGAAALGPLRRLGDPVAGGFEPVRYAAVATLDDGAGPRRASYQRSVNLDDLDDGVVRAMADVHDAAEGASFMTLIHRRHGAAARAPVDASAYPHRKPAFETTFATSWRAGQDEPGARQRVDAVWAAVRGGELPVYVGMLDDEPPFRSAAAYGVHHSRLGRVKALYDPANRFRRNANIEPCGRSETRMRKGLP